jgi:chorismate mutase
MEDLKPFRKQIDDLDKEIMALFGKRFQIIREVAKLKSERGIPTYISDRVEEVKDNCEELARQQGLDPSVFRVLYTILINHACDVEEQIAAQENKS